MASDPTARRMSSLCKLMILHSSSTLFARAVTMALLSGSGPSGIGLDGSGSCWLGMWLVAIDRTWAEQLIGQCGVNVLLASHIIPARASCDIAGAAIPDAELLWCSLVYQLSLQAGHKILGIEQRNGAHLLLCQIVPPRGSARGLQGPATGCYVALWFSRVRLLGWCCIHQQPSAGDGLTNSVVVNVACCSRLFCPIQAG